MMLLLLFGSFFLLLALGVPILFSMGMSAGIYYVVSGYPLMQFVQKTIGGVDSFTLLAIPFFLLAGDIMGKGGISKRMLRFANAAAYLVTTRKGAIRSMPEKEQVLRILEGQTRPI